MPPQHCLQALQKQYHHKQNSTAMLWPQNNHKAIALSPVHDRTTTADPQHHSHNAAIIMPPSLPSQQEQYSHKHSTAAMLWQKKHQKADALLPHHHHPNTRATMLPSQKHCHNITVTTPPSQCARRHPPSQH